MHWKRQRKRGAASLGNSEQVPDCLKFFPRGLKSPSFLAAFGTAEAVPFQNINLFRRSLESAGPRLWKQNWPLPVAAACGTAEAVPFQNINLCQTFPRRRRPAACGNKNWAIRLQFTAHGAILTV